MISIDIEKKLRTYQGEELLKITKQFPTGSITKIYGPSGAGKTTFLKVIAGFIKPEKGRIIVNGTIWFDSESELFVPPQKRMAGFVFQDYALFPNMNVIEHLQYATKDNDWIKTLLNVGKLENLILHKPQYLSGGQQQRLAILRALAIKPKLLLMDEPFSALDPKMKTELIGKLKILFDELGCTVLVVSHNQQELEGLTGDEMVVDTNLKI
jgi:molybdate transport system ATP-binding protein